MEEHRVVSKAISKGNSRTMRPMRWLRLAGVGRGGSCPVYLDGFQGLDAVACPPSLTRGFRGCQSTHEVPVLGLEPFLCTMSGCLAQGARGKMFGGLDEELETLEPCRIEGEMLCASLRARIDTKAAACLTHVRRIGCSC